MSDWLPASHCFQSAFTTPERFSQPQMRPDSQQKLAPYKLFTHSLAKCEMKLTKHWRAL